MLRVWLYHDPWPKANNDVLVFRTTFILTLVVYVLHTLCLEMRFQMFTCVTFVSAAQQMLLLWQGVNRMREEAAGQSVMWSHHRHSYPGGIKSHSLVPGPVCAIMFGMTRTGKEWHDNTKQIGIQANRVLLTALIKTQVPKLHSEICK